LLALTLPSSDEAWLTEFSKGWFDLADHYRVELVGGDTTRGPLTISVQVLGLVEQGTALRRSGGQPGDLIVVTGTLGDAGAGLAIARDGGAVLLPAAADPGNRDLAAQLRARFEFPTARVEFGRAARGLASAAMDLSDGLAGDLPKLARASGVAAHVEAVRVPLSPALLSLASRAQALEWALSAGDDYELLMTVPRAGYERLRGLAQDCALPLSVIGELREGHDVTWSMDGADITARMTGFDHFR
jgi:thiamine-monophosphate kinase